MNFCSLRNAWVTAGLFCVGAAAQQPQAPSPISVGIVFDASSTMGSKLQQSRQVVAQFLKTANSGDEFSLVQSNNRPVLISGFNASADEIQNHLISTQSTGRSALLDAIYLALHELKKARNPRKALLVISDGGDNNSRYTEHEIKNLLREVEIQIYAVGIYESFAYRGRTAEELSGPARLNEIAEQSGGRHFAVERSTELSDLAAKVGTEMRARTQP